MKSYIKFSFILIFSILIFSKCTKSEFQEEYSLDESVTFELNKYDEIGKLHNEKLETFYNEITDNLITNEFKIEKGLNNLYFGHHFKNTNIFPIVELEFKKSITYEEFVKNNSFFTKPVKEYTLSLLEAIDSKSIIEIKNLEIKIINNDLLELHEKRALLRGTSIARYSVYYWYNNSDKWSKLSQKPFLIQANSRGCGSDATKADAISAVSVSFAVGVGLVNPPAGVAVGTYILGVSAGSSAATGLVCGVSWVLGEVGGNTGWWTNWNIP